MGLHWFYVLTGRLRDWEAACDAAAKQLRGMHFPDALRVLAVVLSAHGSASQDLGRVEAGRQLVRQGLALLDEPVLTGQDTRAERAFALWVMYYFVYLDGDGVRAKQLAEQVLALYQELGDRWGMALAVQCLGFSAYVRNNYEEARQRLEESIAASQAIGDRWGIASSYHGLGFLALARDRVDEAIELWSHKAIPNLKRVQDVLTLSDAHMGLSFSLIVSGEFVQARQVLEQGLATFGHLEYKTVSINRAHLGYAEMSLGHYERARVQGEIALALSREAPYPDVVALSLSLLACVALAQAEPVLDAGLPRWVPEDSEAGEAYGRARRLLQPGVPVRGRRSSRRHLAMDLAVLGVAECRLDNLDQAQQHLCEAPRTSAEIDAFLPVMHALTATALLLAGLEEHKRAVELYALASAISVRGQLALVRVGIRAAH